jgi:hypothetical protein
LQADVDLQLPIMWVSKANAGEEETKKPKGLYN